MSDGQAEHVRSAVTVSADISSPSPQYGCVVHVSTRCDVAAWYVLVQHALHVRAAIELSDDMYCPALQVVCAVHEVSRWLVLSW